MSVSAVKGILWSAVAIALVMVFAAAAPAFDRNESLALFYGGCALIVVAILWYRRVIAKAVAHDEEREAQQLLTLKQHINLMGESVSVKASSGLWVVVLSAVLFAFYGHQAFTDPTTGSMTMFALFTLMTAVLALMFVPRIGKPALTIRPDGLAMPLYGFLRWNEIESIGLREYTSSWVTTHSIDLYVPELKGRENRMHPLLRIPLALLSRSSRNFIIVHLTFPSPRATLVHALCYDLWKERTGKNKVWTSFYSEQQIEEARRADERLEMLKRVEAETDPAEAMRLLDNIDKQFGAPSAISRPKKQLRAGATPGRDALLAQLSKLGPSDPAARKRFFDQQVNTYVRDRLTKLAILGVVLAGLLVGALVLFGESMF